MLGKAVKAIREKVGLSQNAFAHKIGVSPRTIAAWESNDETEIPRPPAHMIRTFFQEDILRDKLTKWTDKVFELVPSECVCLWVVEQGRCMLLSEAGANRLADTEDKGEEPLRFHERNRRPVTIPTLIVPLDDDGLTTTPLLTTESIRCAGEEIKNHPNKRHKGTRSANYFAGGKCESLLHVPVFAVGRFGPVPAIVLCIQNKFDMQFEVNPKNPEVYTPEDEAKVKELARGEMRKDVLPTLELLDMLNVVADT